MIGTTSVGVAEEITSSSGVAARATSKPSLLALLGWVGFVLLVLYGVLLGGGWAGIHLVSLRSVSLALIALALLVWFLVSLRLPTWRPGSVIWPTLVIPPATIALATLASRMPRLGLEYVAWGVLLVALYLLLVRILGTGFARERIGALAAMLVLVIGVLYLATVFERWLEWWRLVGGVAVPPLRPLYIGLSLGGPGAVLSVVVPLTAVAYAGLGLASRARRSLLALITVITVVVVIVSGSRGGWLAVAGAVLLVAGIWAMVAVRRGSLGGLLRQRLAQRDARTALGIGLAGGLVTAVLLAPAALQRVAGSGDGGRFQYFTTALRMFEEAPLLGTGPGTWAVQRAAYTDPSELDWYIPHAHNTYLQTLAELGILGAMAGLIALLPVAWLVYQCMRSGSAATRRWAWAGLFILTYLGLHGVVDFHMNFPAVMLIAAIPIAILDATSERGIGIEGLRRRTGDRAARLARGAFWVVCLAAVLILARTESVAWTHERAVAATSAADWEEARGLADDAVSSDPAMPPYQVTRGLVASAQRDWAVAADAYASAAQADDMPTSWLGLAQAQIGLGAPADEAVDSIERALRIGDQQPSVVYAAASLYDRLGMTDSANEAYADAIAALPSLAADSRWTEDEDLRGRYETILDLAIDRAPARAWEIALMADGPDRAHALAFPSGDAGWPDLLIEAWGGDREAVDEIYALADASPNDADVLAWATRLAARYGDDERAARYQRLAIFVVTEGGELPGTEIRVDPDGWLGSAPAGTRMGYAGHYLYRRPLGLDLLPPGLPRLIHALSGPEGATGTTDPRPGP